MVEKIIFYIASFTLFILVFLRLIKKNDTNYVYILTIQFIGILIRFIFLILNVEINILIKVFTYLLSIIIPICIILLEDMVNISLTSMIYTVKAVIKMMFSNEEKSITYLKEIEEKNDKILFVHKKLAKYYEKTDLNLALDEYEKISEMQKDNENICLKIAEICDKLNKKEEAKNIYISILKNNPETYNASMALADIYYDNREYKEAIQIYSQALKYKPTDYNLYYYLGMTYVMLNDFTKAKEAYEKAAVINAVSYNCKYMLGQLALIYGDLNEAEKYFTECINYSEIENDSYYQLSRISMIKGEIDKAINYANLAIEENSNIYNKIYNDIIFITIKDKIRKPQMDKIEENQIIQEENNKINIKERYVKNHLDETGKIVGKLNNNDIEMIANVKKAQERDNNIENIANQTINDLQVEEKKDDINKEQELQ